MPKERLLIHEAKDGYEPLCKFLNLPVPDEAYPRLNETKDQMARLQQRKRQAYLIVFGLPAVLGIGAYFALRHFKLIGR